MNDKHMPILVFMIILVLLTVISIIVFFHIKQYSINAHYPEKSPITDTFANYIEIDDKVLIEYSYSAWTEVYTYYGQLVTKKGDIYNFNCNNTNEYDATKCITKKKGTISFTDLNLINSYITNIDANYKTKTISNEVGEITISFIKNDEEIVLTAKGDFNITNISKDSKKLIKLLKKYKIYI